MQKISCADVGPSCLVGASPIERRGVVQEMVIYCTKEDEDIDEMEENLQCLTMGIPDVTTDKVPRRYQRHTTGISGRFSRLLRRVAQTITCYHEQHQDED